MKGRCLIAQRLPTLSLVLFLGSLTGSCALMGLTGRAADDITLRITEVGASYYQEDPSFIEIYNHGDASVSLSDCTLRSSAAILGQTTLYEGEFPLPAYEVPPRGFVLLCPGNGAEPTEEGVLQKEEHLTWDVVELEVASGVYFPYWTNMGFAELISRGQTVDFVRWGSGGIADPTSGSFESQAPGTAWGEAFYFVRSIARHDESKDTDSGMDWTSVTQSTPGKTNIPEEEGS